MRREVHTNMKINAKSDDLYTILELKKNFHQGIKSK